MLILNLEEDRPSICPFIRQLIELICTGIMNYLYTSSAYVYELFTDCNFYNSILVMTKVICCVTNNPIFLVQNRRGWYWCRLKL